MGLKESVFNFFNLGKKVANFWVKKPILFSGCWYLLKPLYDIVQMQIYVQKKKYLFVKKQNARDNAPMHEINIL